MEEKTVFFFANIFISDIGSGITKKVLSQIRALEKLGYKVKFYTGYTEEGAAIFDEYGNIVLMESYGCKRLSRLTRSILLKKLAEKFLLSSEYNFTVCYVRYLYFDYYFLKFLKIARKKAQNVWLEVHSYPVYVKKLYLYYPIYLTDYIFRAFCLRYIDLIIGVTEYKHIWGKYTIGIENGIDLTNVSLQHKIMALDNEIRLIAVGYEWMAHGYDRLLYGLHEYYVTKPKRKVTLTLVGTVLKSTKKLIQILKLQDYVVCVGKKFGKELDSLYDNADMGIGILAPYRTGNEVSDGLKTREYMAKGLPFVYAGDCLLKDGEKQYHCQISNDGSPVSICDIIEFYDNLSREIEYAQKIREYAQEHSWENQYKKVLSELAKMGECNG